jgi:uncharacterized protein
VRVERHQDASSFLAQAGEFLLTSEAEHNLLVGIAERLRTEPRIFGEDPYMAAAFDSDRVVAVALRTPPHNVILSRVAAEAAIEPLVDDVHAVYDSLPGAIGPCEAVERFVRAWEERTGASVRISMKERIYEADEVRPPEGVPGAMRPYEERDRELVVRWLQAFVDEAMPEPPPDGDEDWLDRRLADPESGVVLWEDGGEAVTLGGYGGLTPSGIRIGPIYTPPNLRRRGYASALTAELTQMLLDRGRRFCFLYTDLANPTSNSIYQRVGYRPVADVDMWSFS